SHAHRAVALDHSRQRVEARFIHENQGSTLLLSALTQSRPLLCTPTVDRVLIALEGAANRHLRRPAQLLQDARHLAFAVGDTEFLLEDVDHAGAGPDRAAEAVGLGAMPKEVRQQPALLWGKLGRVAGRGAGAQRLRSAGAGGG